MKRKKNISDYYGRSQDIRDLTMLDLYDGDAMSCADVGAELGMTKNAVIGLRNRLMKAVEAIEDHCTKPENQNGGMGRKWWM